MVRPPKAPDLMALVKTYRRQKRYLAAYNRSLNRSDLREVERVNLTQGKRVLFGSMNRTRAALRKEIVKVEQALGVVRPPAKGSFTPRPGVGVGYHRGLGPQGYLAIDGDFVSR